MWIYDDCEGKMVKAEVGDQIRDSNGNRGTIKEIDGLTARVDWDIFDDGPKWIEVYSWGPNRLRRKASAESGA